jgi:hypothetical protein
LKSLVLFSYRQPVEGSKFRWGVLQGRRDLKKNPLSSETVNGGYRKWDSQFKRSRTIDYVATREGVKAFYKERQKWGVKIPFVGGTSRFFWLFLNFLRIYLSPWYQRS